jgi:type II secretory pathway component PulL
MAAPARWILFLEGRRLTVARVVRGDVATFDARPDTRSSFRDNIAAVGDLLQPLLAARGYGGEPVLLALGSSSCASATIEVPSERQSRKRSALGFLAEPHLPWSVEEAVIDYELVGSNRAFVVGSEVRPLAELIAILEERGIPVASVAPSARLALAQHLKSASAITSRYALLWRNEDAVDLWLVDNGRPLAWNWLPCDVGAINCAVGYLALCQTKVAALTARNCPDDLLAAVGAQTGLLRCESPPLASEDPLCAAAAEGAAILDGRHAAGIELRRDRLAAKDPMRAVRSHLRLLQGSLLLLFAALGIALYGQCQRLDAVRNEYDQQQRAVFERLFPGQRIPVAVHARLESELGRLKGVRGEGGELPVSIPFLSLLGPVLKTLPADLRCRILEVRVENGQLDLVGQVRAHSDADRIAEALRGAGFVVPSPNTNRFEKAGVEFRISARFGGPDPQKVARKPT